MSAPEPEMPHADVAGYVLGVLDPKESKDFAAHLDACPACRQEVAELASLRVMLDQGMPTPVLPQGLAERTFEAIEAAAAAEPARNPRRQRTAMAAALAGVAAAVVGVVLLLSPDGPPTREVALQPVSAGGRGQGVAHLHRTDAGVAVELSVQGLPAAPEGSYYECWYVGPTDTVAQPARVTAGTFRVQSNGATTVRMITAADYRHFPGIEVTLEPADGNPARTGPAVLRSPPAD